MADFLGPKLRCFRALTVLFICTFCKGCTEMGGLDIVIEEYGLCQCMAKLEFEPLKLPSNENDAEKFNK